jgi:TetR/AcrR family transcriptional repressor of bet genes
MQAILDSGENGARPGRGEAGSRNHERTHAALLDATIRTIAEFSLSGTTVQKVAAAAGVSVGTVILHYKSKDALLIAALEHVASDFEVARRQALLEAGKDPVAGLTALIDVSLDPKVSDPDRIAVWSAFWGEAQAREVYLTRIGKLDTAYQTDLTRLISEVIAVGDYSHLDAEAVALAFAGLLDGQWQEIMISGAAYDRVKARRLILAFLAGLFPRHFQRL